MPLRGGKTSDMRDATVSSHRFSYSLLDGCAIVRPEGACNQEKTEALAKFVNSPLISAKNLVLDLSHAEYVESPGFRWIVRQVRALESDGKRLVLAGVPESVERALKLLKLDSVIPTAKDVRSALAHIDRQTEPATA